LRDHSERRPGIEKEPIILAIYPRYNSGITTSLLDRRVQTGAARFEAPWGRKGELFSWIVKDDVVTLQHVTRHQPFGGDSCCYRFLPDRNNRARAFQVEFAKRARAAGLDRTTTAQFDAATYDIVLLYAHAMKQANVTGEPSKLAAERTAIKDELRKMKNFPALEGAISFGANGDALKPVYVIQLQAGRWTLIDQFAPDL